MRPLALAIIIIFSVQQNGLSQNAKEPGRWFLALPLRFTHLQNNTTMLSGVKLGRNISHRFEASLSIYHSFYLKSFKAEANLAGFEEQPRLFINGMGGEVGYRFLKTSKTTVGIQLMAGWGFMTYDLKSADFRSRQVNYFLLEPAITTEFKVGSDTYLGLGLSYRPIFSSRAIRFTSDAVTGSIPIEKQWPNGLVLLLQLKGLL